MPAPVLTPILSTDAPNFGVADTQSWIRVDNDQGRSLYARAGYITNLSDLSISLSASELSIGSVKIQDGDGGGLADVVSDEGSNALRVVSQDLESTVDDVTVGDKDGNFVSVIQSTSSIKATIPNIESQLDSITIGDKNGSFATVNTTTSSLNINVVNTSIPVTYADSPNLDAFGRLRISQPTTLFDSKSLYDKGRFFWNSRQNNGDEIFLSNDSSREARILNVNGYFVKETYRRFPYQPGKSQLLLFTGILESQPEIVKRVGMFTSLSGNNYTDNTVGIYFEAANDYAWVIRNNSNLVPSQSAIQANWNIDTMDGNGPSGITLDFSKSQIFVVDYEWLGVGRVRCGFNINGVTYYCHQFLHANIINGTYMTDCNLPLRAEIRSTGAISGSMKTICASVMSEGSAEDPSFVTRAVSMSSSVSLQPSDGRRGLLGIRLNPLRTNSANEIVDIGIFPQVNQQNTFAPFKWELVMRPTPAVGVNWNAFSVNSNMQYAQGSDTLTISGGEVVAEGFGSRDTKVTLDLPIFEKCLKLGRNLDGVPDEFWIVVTSLDGDNPFWCSFTIGEAD